MRSTVAHANDFASPDDFVKIAGGLLLLLGFGTMIGPIFAAQAMSHLMPEGLFAFAAIVHLLLALYTLYRMSRRAVPVRPERETFQGLPVPKTATPASASLDPRAPADPDGDGSSDGRPARPLTATSSTLRPSRTSDILARLSCAERLAKPGTTKKPASTAALTAAAMNAARGQG